MAAQCCHACLGAYKRALRMCPAAVKAWQISGQAKVAVKASCFGARALREAGARRDATTALANRPPATDAAVQVSDTDELDALRDTIRAAGLPYYLVEDAGRTQIAPGSPP